jgi:RNA polymerase sigma-B factor
MDHILEYEKLVSKIASKYSYYSSFEDLKQVGMIGLLKAVDKYKPNPNTKFSTYATFWIKGEILDYLSKDKNIKISKEMLSLRKEVEICTDILSQRLGRTPSISEIAFYLEKDEEDIIDSINSKDLVLSSDYYVNLDEDGKNVSLYDTVPYYESGYDENILTLKCALENLDEREQKLIELRYFQDMSQMEVSKEFGTNQVSISRQENKILQKLRQDIAA